MLLRKKHRKQSGSLIFLIILALLLTFFSFIKDLLLFASANHENTQAINAVLNGLYSLFGQSVRRNNLSICFYKDVGVKKARILSGLGGLLNLMNFIDILESYPAQKSYKALTSLQCGHDFKRLSSWNQNLCIWKGDIV